jgi:hypothetical protein
MYILAEQQVPPLRYAPVGMTILFRCQDLALKTKLSSRPERSEVEGPAVLPGCTFYRDFFRVGLLAPESPVSWTNFRQTFSLDVQQNSGCPILCVLCKGWDKQKLMSTFVDPTLRKRREGGGTRLNQPTRHQHQHSHLTRTVGSTDKPGRSRWSLSSLRSVRSMRTGILCTTFT